MNSTLRRELGNRYRSSTHGLPCTRNVFTLVKGLNHGLTGFSFRYPLSVPSISAAVMPGSCENLTNAPPSFRRGRISVTLMGTLGGMERWIMLKGSAVAMRGLFRRLINSGMDLSAWRYGRRNSQRSLRGKTSTINILLAMQAFAVACTSTYCQRIGFLHFGPHLYVQTSLRRLPS